jgi:hypothetical protein
VSGPDQYTFTAKLQPLLCECGHRDYGHEDEDDEERFGPCMAPGCECFKFRLVRGRSQINNSNTRNET